MTTLSKLLCEIVIETGVNDKFKVNDGSGGADETVTLTAGRYRDIIALASEMTTQLDATSVSAESWSVTVSNTTGIVTIFTDDTWDINWDTATYGTTLRDLLGYSGSESVDDGALVASSQHEGGLYPSEPVEYDSRPKSDGTDLWTSDTYQQAGRTGILAAKGGAVRIYNRQITLLLPQDDLESYQTWLAVAATGRSFAFYHDRTEDWDGPSDEYDEYKLLVGDEGVSYAPEPVDETNKIWHRATLQMQRRVAPTT